MKIEAWQRIDALFQEAVGLEPDRLAVLLDEKCAGDADLRAQIESLLETDSQDCDLLNQPALEAGAILLADETPRFAVGQLVAHYEVLKLIGKGGMGEVYMARDRILDRTVALKLIASDYTQDTDRLQRFQREAQSVSALNHPNILTIHELGSFDGGQFIVTELVEGQTLRERLSYAGLSVGESLQVCLQIGEALAAAHRAGIIHRDIKPENIMLRHDGYVKVLDFGLAKLAEAIEAPFASDSANPNNTSSRLLMGTPRYMSPEQIGGLNVDARSDIFSLGCVFYEMLAGEKLFEDNDLGTLGKLVLSDDPISLDPVPYELRKILARMLEKNRDSRYQNVEELLADLRGIRNDPAIQFAHWRFPSLNVSGHATVSGTASSAERNSVPPSFGSRPSVSGSGWYRSAAILLVVMCGASAFGYLGFVLLGGAKTSQREEGRWEMKAPISSARSNAEPVVLNGVLYVAGGWNVCTPFAALEAYDPNSDAWTQRAPMKTARGYHGAAALNGRLYVAGGSNDCGKALDSVEAYDPETNNWHAQAPLPQARSNHIVVAARGKLYAIGGQTQAGETVGLNTRYDPETNSWMPVTPMPSPRHAAAAAVVNDIIYIMGGTNAGNQLTTVEAYDPATDTWSTKSPLLTRRTELGAAAISETIFVFGGSGNRLEVEAYDSVEDRWSSVGKMPGRRSSSHAAAFQGAIYLTGGHDMASYLSSVIEYSPPGDHVHKSADSCHAVHATLRSAVPKARSGIFAASIGRVIYAIGGFDGYSQYLNINHAYDPMRNVWVERAPMPTARATRGSTSAAVVGEKIYVIGGNASGKCTGLNEVYDPATNTWETRVPMPTPRCHLAVKELNGLIYAMGGTNTSGTERYSTVEVYDPILNTWSSAPPMPTARMELAAVSLSNKIYAIGGWNPEFQADVLGVVEVYDPSSGAWTTKKPMKTPRRALAAETLHGTILVVGGDDGEQTHGIAEVYNPVRDEWSSLPSTTKSRSVASVALHRGVLYLLGGESGEPRIPLGTNEAISLTVCSERKQDPK